MTSWHPLEGEWDSQDDLLLDLMTRARENPTRAYRVVVRGAEAATELRKRLQDLNGGVRLWNVRVEREFLPRTGDPGRRDPPQPGLHGEIGPEDWPDPPNPPPAAA